MTGYYKLSNRIPRDAYVIIIGAMRCGTTSLYNYLSCHTAICPAITKEPEFFSENQYHGVHVENYCDLWKFDDTIHKYVMEASTGYTKYPAEPNVPRNIFSYGISPKFIYIIRNPFDRILSHLIFNRECYMQQYKSLPLDIIDKHMINTCNYFLQLEQYKKYFRAENILILDFDELKDCPTLVLKKTFWFLELPHSYFPQEYEAMNSSQTNKRKLTDSEKKFVYNELKDSMSSLYRTYGFEVHKWGFDI